MTSRLEVLGLGVFDFSSRVRGKGLSFIGAKGFKGVTVFRE
jgi:hypothetical protein